MTNLPSLTHHTVAITIPAQWKYRRKGLYRVLCLGFWVGDSQLATAEVRAVYAVSQQCPPLHASTKPFIKAGPWDIFYYNSFEVFRSSRAIFYYTSFSSSEGDAWVKRNIFSDPPAQHATYQPTWAVLWAKSYQYRVDIYLRYLIPEVYTEFGTDLCCCCTQATTQSVTVDRTSLQAARQHFHVHE